MSSLISALLSRAAAFAVVLSSLLSSRYIVFYGPVDLKGWGAVYQNPSNRLNLNHVCAGSAAYSVCTGLWVQNRSIEQVFNTAFSPFAQLVSPLVVEDFKVAVDPKNQSVTVTVKCPCSYDLPAFKLAMGNVTQNVSVSYTAQYFGPFGCRLMFPGTPNLTAPEAKDYTAGSIPDRKLPEALNGTNPLEGVNYTCIAAAVEADYSNKTSQTEALAILYKGSLVFERYHPSQTFSGVNKDTPTLSWSMGKSITNAYVGLRIGQNKVKLSDSLYVPEVTQQQAEAWGLTIENALNMNIGNNLPEGDGSGVSSQRNSLVVKLVFAVPDSGKFALLVPPDVKMTNQSVHWEYSTGTIQLLSRTLRASHADDREHWNFLYEHLAKPLGAPSFVFTTDGNGTFMGSAAVYATARDWLKFGELYLNDGVLPNGTRILPEGWVKYSITVPSYKKLPGSSPAASMHGASWWTGRAFFSKYGDGLFAALGFAGQKLVVMQKKKLVILRTGYGDGGFTSQVLDSIIDCFA